MRILDSTPLEKAAKMRKPDGHEARKLAKDAPKEATPSVAAESSAKSAKQASKEAPPAETVTVAKKRATESASAKDIAERPVKKARPVPAPADDDDHAPAPRESKAKARADANASQSGVVAVLKGSGHRAGKAKRAEPAKPSAAAGEPALWDQLGLDADAIGSAPVSHWD